MQLGSRTVCSSTTFAKTHPRWSYLRTTSFGLPLKYWPRNWMLLSGKRSWLLSMQELLLVLDCICRFLFNTLSREYLVCTLDCRLFSSDGYYRSWRLGNWGCCSSKILVENMVKIMFDMYPIYDKHKDIN